MFSYGLFELLDFESTSRATNFEGTPNASHHFCWLASQSRVNRVILNIVKKIADSRGGRRNQRAPSIPALQFNNPGFFFKAEGQPTHRGGSCLGAQHRFSDSGPNADPWGGWKGWVRGLKTLENLNVLGGGLKFGFRWAEISTLGVSGWEGKQAQT